MALVLVTAAAPALLAVRTAAAQNPTLEKQLSAKLGAFQGEMGVYAKNLDTGETVAIGADQRFPTASLIKVAVMAEVFRQIESGKIRVDQTVVLKDADKAGDETIPLNMMGMRAISGSLPIKFRKRTIAASESIIASSMAACPAELPLPTTITVSFRQI